MDTSQPWIKMSIVFIVFFVLIMGSLGLTFWLKPAPTMTPKSTSRRQVSTQNVFNPDQIQSPGWIPLRQARLQKADFTQCLAGKEPSCLGQNATSPYLVFNFFPKLYPSFTGLLLTQQLKLSTFRLAPDQVFMIYGKSPPPCKYWSYVMYLLNNPDKCNGDLVFAGIADSINNYNSNIPPDTSFAIVYACNSDALARINVTLDYVVKKLVPYQGPQANLTIVERVALFDTPEDQVVYNSNPETYAMIFQSAHPLDPFATVTTPSFVPRVMEFNEHVFESEFQQASQSGLKAVQAAHPDYPYVYQMSVAPFLTDIHYDNGYDCIANCANCNGDNRDTVYLVSYITYEINPDEQIVYVFGVNHSSTGKSAYTNITVYNNADDFGLDSISYTDPEQRYYQIAIVPVPPGTAWAVDSSTDRLILPPGVNQITLAERAYVQTLDSTTGISADPGTILAPNVWILSKTNTPVPVPNTGNFGH